MKRASSSGFSSSGRTPGSTGFGGGSSASRGVAGGGTAVVDSGFSGRVDGSDSSSSSGDWWHGGGSGSYGHHDDDHHHHHGSHFAFSFGFHFGFPFGFYGYSYYPFCGYSYPYSYWWGYPYYWSYSHYPWYWDWGYSCYSPYYRRVVYETRYVDTVYEPSTTVVSRTYLPPAEVAAPSDPKSAESPEAVSARLLSEGDIALRSGDYASAAESFKAAVAADPSSAIARFALGEALFATGDYHYATYSIKKGLELDPAWPDADARKDRFYGSMAAFETGLDRLKDYAATNPYDVASQFLLGYQCYFSGRFDEAEAAFAKHAAIAGDDAAAKLFTDRIPAKKAAAAKAAEAKPASDPKPADTPK